MPAIAGVTQGAMVLEDTTIQNMTLEQWLRVTKPRVEGSINLDNLFPNDTLDFFVRFSSASAIVGNHGQANYTAANTFMTSLAEQRRRRGLAASVIDIGPVFERGYISRTTSVISTTVLQTGGFLPVTEREFHQLFAEAVISGCPGSAAGVELVAGVRTVRREEKHPPVWRQWSSMSHFLIDAGQAADPTTESSQIPVSVQLQLEQARDRDQIYNIVWQAFRHELESQFHLGVAHFSKTELGAMYFDQMGIDSLTAVEIRGWFMRHWR
ncbi:KR domain-containing protein [Xylariomycetidae sp. FL2044]|nr:KR domain-containing protein [Xylariomycetidae sp. FL2044]